jgi:ATP-dependent Lon protease
MTVSSKRQRTLDMEWCTETIQEGGDPSTTEKHDPPVDNPALAMYSVSEFRYYASLSRTEQRAIADAEIDNTEERETVTPMRFQLLSATMPKESKRRILQHLDSESHEKSAKRREHISTLVKIPFGVFRNPFVGDDTGQIINRLVSDMDSAVVGHDVAKRHIVRLVAQWMRGPKTSGFVLGLHGPMGVGKTTLVEKGIAKALGLPYSMLALGGAGDVCMLQGHSYTYEGSMHGHIVGALNAAQCMNPVLFFDELDKVSESPRGEEVVNCLIHLTDSSQNHRFRDRYVGDVDLDMSRAVMIFSFNDRDRVSPTLLDRMNVVKTGGYSKDDKAAILKKHLVPEAVATYCIDGAVADMLSSREVVDRLVRSCPKEDGVRTLKRMLHDVCAEANFLSLVGGDVDVVAIIDEVTPSEPPPDTSLLMMYT